MPGLIVVVQETSDNELLLTALLHDSEKKLEEGKDTQHKRNTDYYLEARDLLLLANKVIDDKDAFTLYVSLLKTYKNAHDIQHHYNGNPRSLKLKKSSIKDASIDVDFSSPTKDKIRINIHPHIPEGTSDRWISNGAVSALVFADNNLCT